jgi:hypothetical protein
MGNLWLISGLMIDVYFANVVYFLAPLLESLSAYYEAWRTRQTAPQFLGKLTFSNVLYVVSVLVAFLPTLITREVIFGSPFQSGLYTSQPWNWRRGVL